MESSGINVPLLLAQIINLALLICWVVLSVLALLQLRRRIMPELARTIWAVVILFVPILGAAVFWLVRPGQRDAEQI